MISLAAIEQVHASSFVPDARVMHVLDVAVFFARKPECDGSFTDFWMLTKPVGPYPPETVLSLAKLHSLLFGGAKA